MHIYIPIWVLWVLGIPAGLVILFLAYIGAMFLWSFRGWG